MPLNFESVRAFPDTADAAIPQKYADNATRAMQCDSRGDLLVNSVFGSKIFAAAAQGSYFMVANTTPGTGVAGIAAADGYDELETLLFIRNATNATTRVYLDFIQLQVTAAGTNGTTTNYTTGCDKGTTRYASGGTSFTPKNCSIGSAVASGLDKFAFGAVVTLTSTSDARLMSSWSPRVGVIKVIGDVYRWQFGDASPAISSMATAGTATCHNVFQHVPVVLGAGDSFLLHEYAASQTVGASYQFTCGWSER